MGTININGMSYNVDQVRNVLTGFELMRAEQPTLLGLIGLGSNAMSTKEEWSEDFVAPTMTTISSIAVNDLTVASVSGFSIGSVIRVASSADASRTEQLKVTNIAGSVMTVSRTYGGTTGATLAIGDKLYLVSNPTAQGTDASAGNAIEPDISFNYTEIFSGEAQISKTTNAVKSVKVDDYMANAEMVEMAKIAYRMNASIIHGRKVIASQGVPASMGGILQFLTGGNVDAGGGALDKAKLNVALESIFNDGGVSNNFAIVCSSNQARRITAMNSTGTNPVMQVQQSSTQVGNYITSFVADLPVAGGFSAKVVVEPSMPRDQVAILDMNKIELAYLNGRQPSWNDATPNGADYLRTRFIAEMTLRVKDGTRSHALLSGLTV